MIKGREAVLQYFEQINSGNTGNIHFSIYNKGQENSGNPCLKTPEVDGWDYDQAFQFLNRWLQFQQYGEFILIANNTPKTSSRGGNRQLFSISLSDNTAAPVAGISGPVMTPESIQQQITAAVSAALENERKARELAELKTKVSDLTKENKELQSKANDPWNKLIAGIEPYIPHLLHEQGLIKTKVAGTPNTHAEETKEAEIVEENISGDAEQDEINTRMETVVEKFIKARPNDWLQILETLADALENKPSLGDKIGLIKML